MTALATLRADAEAIARQLPDLTLSAAAADIMHPGAASRSRVGTGEQFWQYRHYAQTDAADRIDWRRSARSDDYFVRETELETARSILFWCDRHPGFHWHADQSVPTKADRAKTVMLALAISLAKSGERIGMLGSGRPPSLGRSAPDRLAEDLSSSGPDTGLPRLTPPKSTAVAVLASDFYDPIPVWSERLQPLASRCREGVLLAVSDPLEHEFPFSGRTKVRRPGSDLDRLFGRAETVRDDYLKRFKAHRDQLAKLASSMGWVLVTHRTDQTALRGAAALKLAIELFGVDA